MQPYLDALTAAQLERFICRLWERMTAGAGYQPFGFDYPTLCAIHPQLAPLYVQAVRTLKAR
jgi:hypothetical protein